MSLATRQQLRNAQDLCRLRELREQRAQRTAQTAEVQRLAAHAEAQACRERLRSLKELRRDNLVLRVRPGDAAARAHGFVDAHVVQLDDGIERARDAAIDAEDALRDATVRAREAQDAWTRSRARSEFAQQRQQAAHLDHRLELERGDTEASA